MKSDISPLFTVCTPTFNRASLLRRAYDSLGRQTLKDFEWLVIDDGSTDETSDVVKELMTIGAVPLRYIAKPNGGKHTAINVAVQQARGRLFTVIDSDDWFEPRALERMKFHWEQIPAGKRGQYKGVCGHFAYESGELVGDRYPSDDLDADDLDLLLRYQVKGDKLGCTRIEVMREFPFPEDVTGPVHHSFTYLPESIVWHRMGRKYATRFVNEVFGIKQYQPNGISNRSRLIQAENSRATLLFVSEILSCGRKLPLKIAIRHYSNYIRYSLGQKLSLGEQWRNAPEKHLFLLCLPLGYLLRGRDRRLLAQESAERPQAAHP